MDREERRDTAGKHLEDPQDFENISHEVRERQSPSGGEEDCKLWKKTRDLHEEAKQITEKADQSHRRERKGKS